MTCMALLLAAKLCLSALSVIGWLVGWSVTFHFFCLALAHALNTLVAPAYLQATGVAMYPALLPENTTRVKLCFKYARAKKGSYPSLILTLSPNLTQTPSLTVKLTLDS